MELEVQHDVEGQRFFVVLEGQLSRLDYAPAGEKIWNFRSTVVPPDQRGQGIASRIVQHALEYAREHDIRVIPSCWFVKDFIAANPRFQMLVAPPQH
jgi:predicted GNAT family acetyltransferase